MEKIIRPISGFIMLFVSFFLLAAAIFSFGQSAQNEISAYTVFGGLFMLAFVFVSKGIMIVNPNQASVLTLFGKYVGSVKENGLLWVNPFYKKFRISLRSQNLDGAQLKVNDKMGNPIEIATVIVWQASDTYKAVFEVVD